MRKENITKEVIELSKKISEYWRMEIYEGCWYIAPNGKPYLVKYVDLDSVWLNTEKYPLIPDIADLEQKLRELGFNAFEWGKRFGHQEKGMVTIYHDNFYEKETPECFEHLYEYKTASLHLALLSALLEVVKK